MSTDADKQIHREIQTERKGGQRQRQDDLEIYRKLETGRKTDRNRRTNEQTSRELDTDRQPKTDRKSETDRLRLKNKDGQNHKRTERQR